MASFICKTRPTVGSARVMATSVRSSYQAKALLHSTRAAAALHPNLSKGQLDPESPLNLSDIFRYSAQSSTLLPAKFEKVHARSHAAYPGSADKTVSALQGQFLQLLMRMTKPRNVLELGCFMGYSAMAMADGMPLGSKLYTCEKDPKAAQLARDLFVEQGYSRISSSSSDAGVPTQKVQIDLLENDALSSLEVLAQNNIQFDAVFLGTVFIYFIARRTVRTTRRTTASFSACLCICNVCLLALTRGRVF